MDKIVWIKGAGDLATGVAYRLQMAGLPVFLTELAQPLCVRRTVSFAEAVSQGRHRVEGQTAVLVKSVDDVLHAMAAGEIPVAVDPDGTLGRVLQPVAVVDAIMAKRNTCTVITDAPVVIGLGPGFTAGVDCHAVVETQRGHFLGRALYEGSALPDTGIPGELGGVTARRVVRAPASGIFLGVCAIGNQIDPGDLLGVVATESGAQVEVCAQIGGVLRGLIQSGVRVSVGLKVGDVDPTGDVARCHTISDKALAIGGGVLEALLRLRLLLK